MNSNSSPTDSDTQSADLSVDESSELLDELRRATEDTCQDELHEFVCLLTQVLDLHQASEAGETEDGEIATFVATSLDEIRLVFSSGEDSSEQMDSLREQAINRWGEQLLGLDYSDLDDAHDDAWDIGQQAEPDESDPIAPSAEEIKSLLTSLGQSPPADGDADQTPAFAATPAVTKATKQPKSAPVEPSQQSRDNGDTPEAAIAALDPELREAFLDDAQCCVSSMEDALLRLDTDPTCSESLNQICRDLHTLKGASASVGLTTLADQLHTLEDSIRDDQTAGRAPSVDVLLRTVDSIRVQISGNAAPETTTAEPTEQQPKSRVTDHPSGEPPAAAASAPQRESFSEGPADDESVRVKSSQLNRLMDMLAELVMLRNRRETELTQLQDVYHELIGSVSKMRLISNEERTEEYVSSSLQLSEVANDVLEVAQNVRDCARPVAEGNSAVSQFIRQFRQELVELRRTPVSGLFRRLQRAVRDAAQAESKEVRLHLVGEDIGIERGLQQRLYEPLLHIVRNSVCHGIEAPEERSRRGKNPAGTITLEAKSSADLFVIEIRDDGGGLDYDAIRRRGIESGLLSVDQSASREELSQLIFQPGFSTRQTANQVAGRGVGMDVVSATLRRMRGWLEVESEPQQGTRIRLSFPLPSVIQHAMVFRAGGQSFAIPMQSVKSAGEVDSNSVFLSFSELVGAPAPRRDDSTKCRQRIVLACDSSASTDPARRGASVTLLVDEIVGPEEVVVRPLPPLMRHHPFCSGATLSGMGQTVLFLDARRIVQSQSQLLRHSEEFQGLSESDPTQNDGRTRPRVLVVDDSLSARKRVVRSLGRYQVDVVEASDGKQALGILKTQRFAAIFSDMEMPHVSGMELLAEVNSSDRDDAPPVVIISSRGEDEFTSRAKELGVSSYLIKPLSDESLDQALSIIPSLRHLTIHPLSKVPTNGEVR